MTVCRLLIPGFFLLGFFAGAPAGAAEPPPERVGRVSVVDGALALRPAEGEWSDSAINDPVASGMSVRTAAQARAVLSFGSERIALAAASELDLARLDAVATQLVLRRGRIGMRLSAGAAAPTGVAGADPARSIEIDIPRGGVWLLTPGEYDITAGDEHMPARIAVLDGRARFVGKGLDTVIATGSANMMSGNDPVVASLDGAAADDFDAWWRPAGRAAAGSPAPHYLSAEMAGAAALDGNSSWESVDGYGAVWFPKATPDDWAPYRYGHWRWIPPWGWSWIDDMPWGFAPSHYGRWAWIPGSDPGTERWGWVPGSRLAHPVYAPALVAFLGTAGVGLSYPDAVGPAVAWFPLAPGEAYWPSYTGEIDAIRRVNEGAVPDAAAIVPGAGGEPPAAIVTGDYQNRHFASVVPRAVFAGGRPVAPALLQLPRTRLANAPLLAGSPQIAPTPPRAVASTAGPRLAGAMQTLARILTRHGRAPAARPAVFLRPARARALGQLRHARWPSARLARPHPIAAPTSHTGHPRLRLAAAHRATAR